MAVTKTVMLRQSEKPWVIRLQEYWENEDVEHPRIDIIQRVLAQLGMSSTKSSGGHLGTQSEIFIPVAEIENSTVKDIIPKGTIVYSSYVLETILKACGMDAKISKDATGNAAGITIQCFNIEKATKKDIKLIKDSIKIAAKNISYKIARRKIEELFQRQNPKVSNVNLSYSPVIVTLDPRAFLKPGQKLEDFNLVEFPLSILARDLGLKAEIAGYPGPHVDPKQLLIRFPLASNILQSPEAIELYIKVINNIDKYEMEERKQLNEMKTKTDDNKLSSGANPVPTSTLAPTPAASAIQSGAREPILPSQSKVDQKYNMDNPIGSNNTQPSNVKPETHLPKQKK